MKIGDYRNTYVLESTGREITAHRLIIGISAKEDEEGNVYEGYDSPLYLKDKEHYIPFTNEECKEIALFMIGLWQKFGEVK